ncbi:interleukin-8-like [Leucoraja erinacea]|uniref:interleukin-8-like n=1 Tax=Leucoraja erinaceus TaxID=7782 RepID=UPI0024575E58|nr:interleukin-8-like [Leucoraja erinacea]
MGRAAGVTILILLLCAVTAQGFPSLGLYGRCHCIRTRSVFIHPKFIRSLKYIPGGAHCENTEIIITLRHKRKVCVNPDAKWVQAFINANKGQCFMFTRRQL